MAGDPVNLVRTCKERCSLPVIATIRSAQEGGQFFGDAGEWFEKIQPVIPLVDYIDVEQRFASCALHHKRSRKTDHCLAPYRADDAPP